MTRDEVLAVLAIEEAALRSMLAARLSFAGADVLTVPQPRVDFRRHVNRPAVLIIDAPAIAGDAVARLATLADHPHWLQVIVVGSPPVAAAAHIAFYERADLTAIIEAALASIRPAGS